LAGDSDESLSSPQYATTVGLLMNGLKKIEKEKAKKVLDAKVETPVETTKNENVVEETPIVEPPKPAKKTFFERWVEKFKEFIDNAE
jgi:cell division protein FtsA